MLDIIGRIDICMFSARLLWRSLWSPSGVDFDSDSGVILGTLGDILRDSGGFKLGPILGTCSGEAGAISCGGGHLLGWRPQIPKRRPSGHEKWSRCRAFFRQSRAKAQSFSALWRNWAISSFLKGGFKWPRPCRRPLGSKAWIWVQIWAHSALGGV